MKTICFITPSRADFGTLNELIKEVIKEFFLIQLIISGLRLYNVLENLLREGKKNIKKKILDYLEH